MITTLEVLGNTRFSTQLFNTAALLSELEGYLSRLAYVVLSGFPYALKEWSTL